MYLLQIVYILGSENAVGPQNLQNIIKMLKRVGIENKEVRASKDSYTAGNWPPKKIWQRK